MPNEIIIHVKAVNDTKAVFDRVRADARDLGDTIAIDINKHVTERLQREADASAGSGGGFSRAGDTIGETIGKRVSERITERIKVDVSERLRDSRGRFLSANGGKETVHVEVDVDQKTLTERLAAFGGNMQDKISGWFEGGISTGITSVFSGDFLSTILKGSLVALGASVLAPALGGAIGAAVLTTLSGGAIAVGILGAMKDPRISKAFDSVKEALGFSTAKTPKDKKNEPMHGLFDSFSENFKGPLENFLAPGNGGGGGVVGLIRQITPLVDQLGKALGPVADKLGNGIIGFLQNVLPSVITGMEAGGPLIETLADRLPGIGDALGDLFNTISNHADEADMFFNDFLHAIEFTIRAVSFLVATFLDMYKVVRGLFVALTATILNFVGVTIRSLADAFGWIPGLGPKLKKASADFDKFSANVIKKLSEVPDHKYIDIHLRTIFNGVGQTVGSITRQLRGIGAAGHAHGGVVGTAASGGSRNGLTLVGEQGPELADLAPGSSVYSNADSLRMAGMSGGGGGGVTVINLLVDGKLLARVLADPMRSFIRNSHGGSVQAAYGS
jgi:hypothetical protein